MNPKGDTVTVSRKDWPRTSFAAFEDMRQNGILCDMSITLRNHTFKAHKLILAAGIPYFRSLCSMSDGDETSKDDISLGDFDPKATESLIQFAYTGRIDISFDNVHSLIRASNFLQLTEVLDACVEFLLPRLNNDIVVRMHNLGHEFAIPTLTGSTIAHIAQNFEVVSKLEDFLHLPHSCIQEVISEDDLYVSNEETVFEAVIQWVNVSPSERHQVLPELLREVRMTYLHTDYLINRVTSEELVRTSKACMSLLEDVKNYHLLPKTRISFSKLKTQPRKFRRSNGGIYALFYCHTAGYSVYHCDFDNSRMSQNLASEEGPHGAVFGVAAVHEKIYMFHEKTIRTFDLRTLQWRVLHQPGHTCLKGAAFVTHGDVIYSFGSFDADFSNRVRCFDPRQNKWLKEERMRTGRYNSSAASLGEDIYVTGGFWGYLIPSYMYLMGYSGGTAVENYSPSKKQCKKIAPMLIPRQNHFCAGMRGKIYVCGGGIVNNSVNTAEVYDPFTRQWNFISSMPPARSCFSLLSFNGKIYAIEADRGVVCYEIFDPGSNRWTAGFPLRNECGFQGNLRTAIPFPATRH